MSLSFFFPVHTQSFYFFGKLLEYVSLISERFLNKWYAEYVAGWGEKDVYAQLKGAKCHQQLFLGDRGSHPIT